MMNAFRMYKMFDLIVLSVIAIGAEVTSIVVGQALPAAGFYLSFSGMIAIIALVRWKSLGLIVSALSTLPVLYFSETVSTQFVLYYLISSSMVGFVPFIFKKIKTATIVGNGYLWQLYIICFYGILFVSRGLLAPLVGLSFTQAMVQSVWQLSFSMIMSCVFLALFRQREGLLVDMSTYIYKEVIQE